MTCWKKGKGEVKAAWDVVIILVELSAGHRPSEDKTRKKSDREFFALYFLDKAESSTNMHLVITSDAALVFPLPFFHLRLQNT